jgi:hypothetical protein
MRPSLRKIISCDEGNHPALLLPASSAVASISWRIRNTRSYVHIVTALAGAALTRLRCIRKATEDDHGLLT